MTVDGNAIGLDEAYLGQSNGVSIQRDGDYTYLSTSMGLRVKWDGASSVYVTVDREQHYNLVSGLCGFYNGEPAGKR